MRSFEFLAEAAECKYPPAQYALGIHHDGGGIVPQNFLKAASLFKAAAKNRYPEAQLSYGLDLHYGSNGIRKDVHLVLDFVRKAAKSGIDEAVDTLNELGKSDFILLYRCICSHLCGGELASKSQLNSTRVLYPR